MSTNESPTALITIGMAGTGKTSVVGRIASYLSSINAAPYLVNLDPAVKHLKFNPNIDIRDTVDYKQVMKEYSLGVSYLSKKSQMVVF